MKSIRVAIATVFVCLALGHETKAQIDEHRFEVGGLLTGITLTDFQGRTLPGFSPVDETIIHYQSQPLGLFSTGLPAATKHNLQASLDLAGDFEVVPTN